MKIFLLGAGKPAFGNKPSALKQVSFSTTVLDWIINSFKSFASQKNIHFLEVIILMRLSKSILN